MIHWCTHACTVYFHFTILYQPAVYQALIKEVIIIIIIIIFYTASWLNCRVLYEHGERVYRQIRPNVTTVRSAASAASVVGLAISLHGRDPKA